MLSRDSVAWYVMAGVATTTVIAIAMVGTDRVEGAPKTCNQCTCKVVEAWGPAGSSSADGRATWDQGLSRYIPKGNARALGVAGGCDGGTQANDDDVWEVQYFNVSETCINGTQSDREYSHSDNPTGVGSSTVKRKKCV